MATTIQWDAIGERLYEVGVEKGVCYPLVSGAYPNGYAWNGLTAVTESPTGAEATPIYADNTKYITMMSTEEFGITIEAYTYPKEFEACDGTAELEAGVTVGQQTRKPFGLTYVTNIGNDEDMNDHGYKIHCVYGILVSPSEKAYGTVNDSPEAITFSWEGTTTPVAVSGTDAAGNRFKPTSTVIIDSTKVDEAKLAAFEAMIWGDGSSEATLPLPDAIKEHFATA